MNATARLRWLAAGLVAAAIATGGLVAWHPGWLGLGTAAPQLPPGQSLAAAQLEILAPVPDFALTGATGTLTRRDLQGRWAFVFFGYTNCPNACPATLAILNHVQEALRARGAEAPRIVFVSLDPARDTPAMLQRYVSAFGSDAVGVTGDPAALQGLMTFFGVTVERQAGADAAGYTLDHTTNFFLLRPDGRWLATFAPADDGEAVLDDTATLMGPTGR